MDNTTKARILRRNQTDAEAALWNHLRGRRLGNYKFRRQVPVGPYVADFLCKEAMMIIEIDGGQHSMHGEYDQYRDAFLRARGYEVVRFWNNEVMANRKACWNPSPEPLPTAGRLSQRARDRRA